MKLVEIEARLALTNFVIFICKEKAMAKTNEASAEGNSLFVNGRLFRGLPSLLSFDTYAI